MTKKMITALDDYINKVYAIVLLSVTGACQAAGILYTAEKLIGLFPTVPWILLIIFDITCLVYLGSAVFLVKTGYSDKMVKNERLKQAKIFLIIVMYIQFNFILYMIPSTEFWAFAFLFTVATALFLDHKMVIVTGLGLTLSVAVSWFAKPDVLMPVKNELLIPNMINRIVCIVLSLTFIWLFTWLVQRFLVHAKKDEMEKNNERVQNMLHSVAALSAKLGGAGNALSDISQNESSSAEELAATSENLLAGNNRLGKKSDDSIENLNELQQWEQVVSEQVGRVENSSRELLEKSRDNENRMRSLKEITNAVSESMENTNRVAEKLSEAVKEIDVALNVIDGISSSTSLLALNASIEAARAGEAGRGFAVVAQSVGGLAKDTQESLGQVGEVIGKVQQNVGEMTAIVNDNSEKLARQNEYFEKVFVGIQEMIEILRTSIEDIAAMGDARDKQSVVIRNTVEINKAIAESIKDENAEFTNINRMVENNANDVEQMTVQIGVLNHMVEEINCLLSQEN